MAGSDVNLVIPIADSSDTLLSEGRQDMISLVSLLAGEEFWLISSDVCTAGI